MIPSHGATDAWDALPKDVSLDSYKCALIICGQKKLNILPWNLKIRKI